MLTVVNTKIHGSMAKGVNIYELMHACWQENEYEPFSTAEIAMFFFLLLAGACQLPTVEDAFQVLDGACLPVYQGSQADIPHGSSQTERARFDYLHTR